MAHKFEKTILRKYDVRGIYGKDLHDIDAYFFGFAYAKRAIREFAKEKKFSTNNNHKKENKKQNYLLNIVVGCDGRVSSPNLHKELIRGILDAGINVIDIGVASSPMVCFVADYLKSIACVAVTASHNPKEYNGFKFDLKGKPFFDTQILQLAKFVSTERKIANKEGKYKQINLDKEYLDHVCNIPNLNNNTNHNSVLPIKSHKPNIDNKQNTNLDTRKPRLKVLFDCGNGVTGPIIVQLCKKLKKNFNILADAIFTEINGNFPNHHPDPTVKKNMEILSKEVVKNNYDIGIGFDGDGDRIGIIDEKGRLLYGDQILLILAKDILKQHPNAKIVAEVKASKVVYDEIKRAGGNAIMSKIGHTYIHKVMDNEGALLGGETSGHIFFSDYFKGVDDAIYAGLRMIAIILKNKRKMSEFVDEIPATFCTHDLKLEISEVDKFKIIERIAKKLKKEKREFNDLDGIRIDTNDGWWMVRASNTQNVLVGRCESDTKEGLENIKKEFTKYVVGGGYKQDINFDN